TTAVRVSPLRPTSEAMVMRIVTRCTTLDEFILAFRELCTERTLFIPSAQARATGIETGFSLRPADGAPVMSGLCVVLSSWSTVDNPYQRRGVRLGIRSLTPESRQVLHRILRARSAPIGDLCAGDTLKTVAPAMTVQPRPPASLAVLPANPLSEM